MISLRSGIPLSEWETADAATIATVLEIYQAEDKAAARH